MIVLVSDTSVLIDLERAELLEHALTLRHQFAVPDALYEIELRDHEGEQLVALGLRVVALDAAEVAAAAEARRHSPKLSIVDTFALALAEARGWMLLAGDALLREEAIRRAIECHGTLWVFDQVELAGIAEPAQLAACLERLAGHRRCRLPRREIELRLIRYRG